MISQTRERHRWKFVSFPASSLSFTTAHYLVGMLSPLFPSKKMNFLSSLDCYKKQITAIKKKKIFWPQHQQVARLPTCNTLNSNVFLTLSKNTIKRCSQQNSSCMFVIFSSSPLPCLPLPNYNILFLSFGNSCNTRTNCYRINSKCLGYLNVIKGKFSALIWIFFHLILVPEEAKYASFSTTRDVFGTSQSLPY